MRAFCLMAAIVGLIACGALAHGQDARVGEPTAATGRNQASDVAALTTPTSLGLFTKSVWAVVSGDGTLARGHGVVSTKRLAIGGYEVVFKEDVSKATAPLRAAMLRSLAALASPMPSGLTHWTRLACTRTCRSTFW